MPIDRSMFDGDATPQARSGADDPQRPFLFEGLEPRFATRRIRSVFVPMRDGVRLSTDFYVPIGAEGPLPVVLSRTPYGKNQSLSAFRHVLPEQGIVYALQDVRGRHESEGEFVACAGGDRDDGFDTVDWIARQPWCNGAVGVGGSSYLGETAAKTVASRHPAVRAALIMFDGAYAGGETRNGAFLQGGVTLLRLLFQWFREMVPAVSYGPPPHVDREGWYAGGFGEAYASQPVALPPIDIDAHLLTLPVATLVERSGGAPSAFATMMRHASDPGGAYWDRQRFLTDADRIDVPALHITGPTERGGSGFDNFALFQRNATNAAARDHQHLIFSPAPHSRIDLADEHSMVGARSLGDTRFPYYATIVGWFSHWLRGDATAIQRWPAVRYFDIGRKAWRDADTWPPAGTRETSFFLAMDDANRGVLMETVPDLATHAAYRYDPADPTPSSPPDAEPDALGGGYVDRQAIRRRPDVVAYASAPLERDLVIAGPVRVALHVASSAIDTDFVAVLVEIDGEGRAVNVTHGNRRMRWREGFDRPRPIEKGVVHAITIDLWHAAITISRGHRLGLDVCSSHFPFYERNLNTGGDNFTDTAWAVADNVIHHGPATPSALVLHVATASDAAA